MYFVERVKEPSQRGIGGDTTKWLLNVAPLLLCSKGAKEQLEAGRADLAGLRPGDDGQAGANNGRVKRMLSQKRAAPEYLINESYALVLHDQ